MTADPSAAADTLFEARARLRQRIEAGLLRSPYPIEHIMGIADSWADERADARVAAERERIAAELEALPFTGQVTYEAAIAKALRIARGQP